MFKLVASFPLLFPQAPSACSSPQRFVETQISGPSSSSCPVAQELAPEMSKYQISLPKSSNIPELTPLIAVLGTAASASFLLDNVSVQPDLDQTHAKNTFRACGANDGVVLSQFNGILPVSPKYSNTSAMRSQAS